MRSLSLMAIAILATPYLAYAQTFSQVVGLFNILVGLMIVAAFLTFIGGFIVYLVRYGNDNRVEGIKYMEWGVVILFVLIVVLALVHLVQNIFT